jgi:hypothetical protein
MYGMYVQRMYVQNVCIRNSEYELTSGASLLLKTANRYVQCVYEIGLGFRVYSTHTPQNTNTYTQQKHRRRTDPTASCQPTHAHTSLSHTHQNTNTHTSKTSQAHGSSGQPSALHVCLHYNESKRTITSSSSASKTSHLPAILDRYTTSDSNRYTTSDSNVWSSSTSVHHTPSPSSAIFMPQSAPSGFRAQDSDLGGSSSNAVVRSRSLYSTSSGLTPKGRGRGGPKVLSHAKSRQTSASAAGRDAEATSLFEAFAQRDALISPTAASYQTIERHVVEGYRVFAGDAGVDVGGRESLKPVHVRCCMGAGGGALVVNIEVCVYM